MWGKASKVALNKCKKTERDSFENDMDKLFDLTTCPHKITLCEEPNSSCSNPPCSIGAHIECDCPMSQKIPKLELRWMNSQRAKVGELSEMYMGTNDQKETKKQEKTERRKLQEEEANRKRLKREEEERVHRETLLTESEFDLNFEDGTLDDDMEVDMVPSKVSPEELTLSVPLTF